MIFGIFDINIMDSKEEKNDNSYFDDYYSEFGNIISLLDDIRNDRIRPEKLRDICIKIYSKSKIEKSEDKIISTYCEALTLSQYRTRLGLFLCYYFNLYEDDFN